MLTYRIVRFYRDGTKVDIIERGVSLEEAQKHCSDPATRQEGVWFDGYEVE